MTLAELLKKASATRWPTDSLPAVPPGYDDGTNANSQWAEVAYGRTGSPAAAAAAALLPEIAGMVVPSGFGGSAAKAVSRTGLKNAPVQVNIEATSPSMLQGANSSAIGRVLSDLRYAASQSAARKKGMKMADAPVTKAQGVWVDNGGEEFNRVYAQDLGQFADDVVDDFGIGSIKNNPALADYANEMGANLRQVGVGAARFSPHPLNIGSGSATGLRYGKASPEQIIEAGRRINPSNGVVSATPDGGMLVFDADGGQVGSLAKALKGVAGSPKYGQIDPAFFYTKDLPSNPSMQEVDNLIRFLGY